MSKKGKFRAGVRVIKSGFRGGFEIGLFFRGDSQTK